MEIVQNEVLTQKTVMMDDKHFVGCKYTECKLIYNGGETQWTDSTFDRCQVVLSGAAQRTANLLVSFGAMAPGGTAISQDANVGFPKKPNGRVQ